jgi:hypothetical protein
LFQPAHTELEESDEEEGGLLFEDMEDQSDDDEARQYRGEGTSVIDHES